MLLLWVLFWTFSMSHLKAQQPLSKGIVVFLTIIQCKSLNACNRQNKSVCPLLQPHYCEYPVRYSYKSQSQDLLLESEHFIDFTNYTVLVLLATAKLLNST